MSDIEFIYPQEITQKIMELEMKCLVLTDISVTDMEQTYLMKCKVNGLETVYTILKDRQSEK